MIANAFTFLLETLIGLLTLAFLLRCYLQLARAPFHNQFAQGVIACTNFAVRPLRRFVPAIGWLDTASLLLAVGCQFLLQLALLWLHDFPLLVAGSTVFLALLGLAVLGVVKLTLYLLMYTVILQAILSWINPHSPAAPVLDSLTHPFLRPLRRHLPTAAGIDFSPLVVFIVIQLLLMLLVAPLEIQLLQLYR